LSVVTREARRLASQAMRELGVRMLSIGVDAHKRVHVGLRWMRTVEWSIGGAGRIAQMGGTRSTSGFSDIGVGPGSGG
jgi:hypothetical protein